MFKVHQKLTPTYLSKMFTLCSHQLNDSYRLRSASVPDLALPKPHTELFKSSLSYSGVKCWNTLPHQLRLSSSYTNFRKCFYASTTGHPQ